MSKKTKEYQKLPGFKKGFLLGKHTLWQGQDHLLQIFFRMGAEDYKRFYFSDIQAIITRKTAVGKVMNAILAGFIISLSLPAFFFDGIWAVFFAVSAGVVLVFLLINVVRGPTCDTRLKTAVQIEKMHSLHRLKNTLKVMDRLQPPIRRAQGNIPPQNPRKTSARQIDANGSKDRPKLTVSSKVIAGRKTAKLRSVERSVAGIQQPGSSVSSNFQT